MAETKIEYAPLPYGLDPSFGRVGLKTSADHYAEINSMVPSAPAYQPAAGRAGRTAAVAYSASMKKFFIAGGDKGYTFSDGDDTAAVEAMKVFTPDRPMELPPGDWQPLSPEGYSAYVGKIANPSMGRLAKKNFGIGVDNLQALVGSGLKFAGAEETGQNIIDQQVEDLAKTSVYQRAASDIGSDPSRGILDWFVANLAQQGPNIVESAVTAVLGAAAGGAAGGGPNPITAAGGAFMALVGKSTAKAALLAAAKKYSAGEALDAVEKKLLMEAAGITAAAQDVATQIGSVASLRQIGQRAVATNTGLEAGAAAVYKQAGRAGGAGLATLGSNQAMGIADIYSEEGASRGEALAMSIPYSLLESSTEFLLAGRVLGDLVRGGRPLKDLGYSRKALELLRRTSVGGAVGGAAEGTVEAGQEALLLAANPSVDWDSPDGITRLFNAFAAGAGVGGPIGSIANLRGRTEPANLLQPNQGTNPVAPAPAAPAPAPVAPAAGPAAPAPAPAPPAGPPAFNQLTQLGIRPPDAPIPSNQGVVPPRPPIAGLRAPGNSVGVSPTLVPHVGGYEQYGKFMGVPSIPSIPPAINSTIPAPPAAAPPAPAAAPAAAPAPAQQAAAPVLTAAQVVPTTTPGEALQKGKGKRSPVIVRKAEMPKAKLAVGDMAKHYGDMIARILQQPNVRPGAVELAERLADMPDRNLRKLAAVWKPEFEPDVTPNPIAVMKFIDRALDMKPKVDYEILGMAAAAKVAPTPVTPAPDVIATPTSELTAPLASPPTTSEANKTITDNKKIASQVGKKGAALKKGKTKEAKPTKGEGLKRGPRPSLSVAEISPPTGTVASTQFMMTQQMRKELADLGYTKDQVGEMAPVEAREIINAKTRAEPPPKSTTKNAVGPPSQEQPAEDETPKLPILTKEELKARRAQQYQEDKARKKEAEEKAKKAAEEQAAGPVTLLSSTRTITEDGAVWNVKLSDGTTVPIKKEPGGGAVVSGWYRDDVVGTPTEVTTKGYLGDSRAEAEARLLEEANKTQPAEKGKAKTEKLKIKMPTQTFTSELNEALDAWLDPKEETARTNSAQFIIDAALFPDSNDRKPPRAGGPSRAEMALAAYNSILASVERGEGDMGVSLDRAIVSELRTRISEQEVDSAEEEDAGMKALKTLAAERGVLAKVIAPAPGVDSAVLQAAADASPLVSLIDEMLTNKSGMQTKSWRADKSKELRDALIALRNAKLDPVVHGVPASTLLNKQGQLDINLDTTTNTFRLGAGFGVTAAEVMKDSDAPTGMFSRVDDGTPLTKKFAPAEVRLKVTSLISRFKFKPKIAVFRSIADLKEKNPALYKRAAAARVKGDFDGTNAAGYSFGDQVLIFSDYIRDEQHLAKVVAHETLGHFGLRAFMPKSVLATSLDRIYQSDSRLRAVVDQIVENTGMDRAEVVEEYLADFAARIDTSLLRDIWFMLKNALNKLGIRFHDDHARLLVNQARRYVRNGGTSGSFFSATSMLEALERMAAEHGTGRFATADPLEAANPSSRMTAAQALTRSASRVGGFQGLINHAKRFGPAVAFRAQKGVTKDLFTRIAQTVQSLDYRASRSEGLGEVYRLFEQQHNMARQILNQLQGLTAFTHKANWGVAQKDAPTEADKLDASDLLGYAALYKHGTVTTTMMDSYGPLMKVDEYGNVEPNLPAIEKMQKDGFVTADEFRNGLKWTDSLGEEQTYPKREIDENSKAWQIYKEQRNAVNAAAMAVLQANYNSLAAYDSTVFASLSGMSSIDNKRFTPADQEVLRKVARKFHELYLRDHTVKGAKVNLNTKNKKLADNFIYQVTRVMDDQYGKEKLKDWMDGTEGTAAFQGEEFAEIRAGLTALVEMRLSDTKGNRLKQVLQNVAFSVVDSLNAEYRAKTTILTSYAPMTRSGRFQVQLKAVDADGKPVALHSTYQGVMPYYRDDDEKVATVLRDDLGALFGTGTYKVLNSEGMEVNVTFVAEYSAARQTPDLGDVMDYSSFVHILERSSIEITPAERERLIRGLTGQGDMARKNMEKTGNPGWRPDMIRNLSEHLETSAHVAAKRAFRNQMDAVISDERKWKGDREKLERLRAAYKAEGLTPTQRDYRKREYDAYAFKFADMTPATKGGVVDIEVNGKAKSLPMRGRGEEGREEAKQLLNWQSETLDITDSTEDFLSHGWGAQARTMTVLWQLGASVATAVVNLGSLVTHSTVYMAFYNERNGFGMGFGMAKSSMAISTALSNLKNNGFGEADFIAKIIKDGTHAKYGLTPDEARFLLEQTTNGTLLPSMSNALIGSARGKAQSNRINDAIQKWMFMFSYTEALNRRVTALAAYRMELARIQASTDMSEKKAQEAAATAAHNAVRISQGEYAMFNRPELARGGLGQYIFMYKMFTVVTVQLMRSLPPSGRLAFLGMMIFASGMKGVPFAEDLMDLVDTLAQMFGIKMPSIEKEAYQLFDALAPGWAPYFMRGALDQLTGSTVSSKVGMGDIIPLSGAWKYGSDPWQETKNFLGPVFGAGAGTFNWAQLIGKYGAEAVGLKSDATTFNDLLRESPLAVMRSIGDSMAYMESGAITNIRGQVVSRDVGAMTSVMRLMGFYPAESTRQNDIIRIAKMGGEYAKAIKADMVNAYTQAGIRGDRERMKHIAAQVIEWNISAKGTGLEIKDFQNAAKKSFTEASREAVSRFQRTVSKQMRPQVEELMRLQGVDAND